MWPSIGIFIICMLLVFPSFFWKSVDSEHNIKQQRWITVDGLRGFLALAVVMHHCVISYEFHQSGVWKLPPSSYYTMLGQAGVSIFFMITAFLFWGKVIDSKNDIDWFGIYIGRLFRIIPLYWVTIVFMLILLGIKTKFELLVPIDALIEQLSKWILPGTVRFQPQINGYQYTNTLTAGVMWTLYFEWLFYLMLPVIYALSIKKSVFGFLPLGILLVMIIPDTLVMYLVSMFIVGMIGAAAVRKFPELLGDGYLKSLFGLSLIFLTLIRRETAYEWTSVFSLGAFFLIVASGSSLFGLLKSKSAIRLGAMSYGIYLLQGPVITLIFSNRILGEFSKEGPKNFWISSAVIVILLIILSAITYIFIEKPSIKFGKNLYKKFSSKS